MSLANSLSLAGKMNELAGYVLCGKMTGGIVEVSTIWPPLQDICLHVSV